MRLFTRGWNACQQLAMVAGLQSLVMMFGINFLKRSMVAPNNFLPFQYQTYSYIPNTTEAGSIKTVGWLAKTLALDGDVSTGTVHEKMDKDFHGQEVPRIIHQMWKNTEIPRALYGDYPETWRRNHPDWEYRFWTDEGISRLVAEHYPWFQSTYKGYPEAIQRADAARYMVMHLYGGVYADLDMESIQAIDPLLHNCSVLLSYRTGDCKDCDGGQSISNAIFASTPRHPLWISMLHSMMQMANSVRMTRENRIAVILSSTGPKLFSECVRHYLKAEASLAHGSAIKILHSDYLFRKWPRRSLGTHHETFAMHHFKASWQERGQKIIRDHKKELFRPDTQQLHRPKSHGSRGKLTLFTGTTAVFHEESGPESYHCDALRDQLKSWWTSVGTVEVHAYLQAIDKVRILLGALNEMDIHCRIDTMQSEVGLSFPLSYAENDIISPAFIGLSRAGMLYPDLVLLSQFAAEANVNLRYIVGVSASPSFTIRPPSETNSLVPLKTLRYSLGNLFSQIRSMDSHSKALLLDASWSLDNIDERIGDLQDVVRYLYVGNNKAQPCLSKSSEILGSEVEARSPLSSMPYSFETCPYWNKTNWPLVSSAAEGAKVIFVTGVAGSGVDVLVRALKKVEGFKTSASLTAKLRLLFSSLTPRDYDISAASLFAHLKALRPATYVLNTVDSSFSYPYFPTGGSCREQQLFLNEACFEFPDLYALRDLSAKAGVQLKVLFVKRDLGESVASSLSKEQALSKDILAHASVLANSRRLLEADVSTLGSDQEVFFGIPYHRILQSSNQSSGRICHFLKCHPQAQDSLREALHIETIIELKKQEHDWRSWVKDAGVLIALDLFQAGNKDVDSFLATMQ